MFIYYTVRTEKSTKQMPWKTLKKKKKTLPVVNASTVVKLFALKGIIIFFLVFTEHFIHKAMLVKGYHL